MKIRITDRGTVLILSMMLLLVLTGLSFVVVQSTINSMNRCGSFRASSVAYQVAQAGSEATMALAARDPTEFVKFLKGHNNRLTMNDVSDVFFDISQGGSFGGEYEVVGGVNWISYLRPGGLPDCNVPGYQTSYCFYKFYAITDGWYGIGDEGVVNPDDVLRNPQKRFIATIHVGPLPASGW